MMMLRELSGHVFVGDFAAKYAETDGKDGGGEGEKVVVRMLVLITRDPVGDRVGDCVSEDVEVSFAPDEEW